MFYQIISVGKEDIGLVWDYVGKKPQVEYIYLPIHVEPVKTRIIRDFPAIDKMPHNIPGSVDKSIANLYAGKKDKLNIAALNLDVLTKFSDAVLKLTCQIPRGKVTTYSSLAAKIGKLRAARAVGTALANNPFPIVIPCHRVVRADGSLGGFGGGLKMKRELLEKEGVIIEKSGKVSEACFW